MNIPTYLEKHDLSQAQFASLVGVTQSMVWQWLSGRRRVGARRAKIIEQKTGGKITRRELLPDVFA